MGKVMIGGEAQSSGLQRSEVVTLRAHVQNGHRGLTILQSLHCRKINTVHVLIEDKAGETLAIAVRMPVSLRSLAPSRFS
jgi:hypothetical protein